MLAGRLKMGDASNDDTRLRGDPRGRDGGVRKELAAAVNAPWLMRRAARQAHREH
jgi:hypothetical protein